MTQRSELVSSGEVAQILGIGRQSAWKQLKSGKIPGARKIDGGGCWVAEKRDVIAFKKVRGSK